MLKQPVLTQLRRVPALRTLVLMLLITWLPMAFASMQPVSLDVTGPAAVVIQESRVDYQIRVSVDGEYVTTVDLPALWYGRDYYYFDKPECATLEFEFVPVNAGEGHSPVEVERIEVNDENKRFLRALSQLGMGKLPDLQSYPNTHPMFPELRLNVANTQLAQGKLQAAWNTLKSEQTSTDPRILRTLSKIKRDEGAYELAAGFGERAVKRYQAESEDLSPQPNRMQMARQLDLALALTELGDVYLWLGKFDQAKVVLEQALDLAEPSLQLQSMIYNNLSGVYDLQFDYAAARPYQQQAVELALKSGDLEKAAQSTYLIGHGYRSLGRYDLARQYFYDALALLDSREPGIVRGYILLNTGGLHVRLGNYAKAKLQLAEAMQIAETFENRQLQGQVSNLLAKAAEASGNLNEAREFHTRYMRYLERPGARLDSKYVNARIDLNRVHLSEGRLVRANEYANETLRLAERLGEDWLLADARLGVAEVYLAQKNYRSARDLAETAIAQYQVGENYLPAVRAYGVLSRISVGQGDVDGGVAFAEQAIEQVDKVRNLYLDVGVGQEFVANLHDAFFHLTNLYVAKYELSGDALWLEKAFAVSEISRGYYRDSIDTVFDSEKQQNISTLQQRIFAAAARGETLVANQLSLELDVLRATETAPRSTTTLDLANYSFSAAQALLAANEMFLQFVPGRRKSLLFAVTKDDLEYFELPSVHVLQKAIDSLLPLLSNPGANPFQELQSFTKLLLPDELNISGINNLVVSADGALRYIPFAALARPGVERYEPLARQLGVTYASSLQGLSRHEAAGLQTVAVVSPERLSSVAENTGAQDEAFRSWRENLGPLPWAAREAEDLRSLFGAQNTRLVTGESATLANLVSGAIDKTDIVHFATHGYFSDFDPEFTGLMLSGESGQLEFANWRDFLHIPSSARLMVVNGCETALGREMNGLGFVGLTSALIQSGASEVMTTLWKISDRASREMMLKFYQEIQAGRSTREALRLAQNSMMSGRYRHPFYWAGYVVHVGGANEGLE